MMEMRAAGGTRAPLMLDWLIWLSMPNVKAEWENPASGGTTNTSVCGSHSDRVALKPAPQRRHNVCSVQQWPDCVFLFTDRC